MNKKKMIISTTLVLSMTFGGLVGCSNQTSTTPRTQNVKKKVTLDKKADETENSIESKSETASTTEISKANTSSSSSSSNSNKTNTTASTSSNSNKNNSSSSNSNSSPQHTHNWVAQTKTVHHDASYTKKYVIDQEGKDVQLPQYESEARDICNVCGADITDNASSHTKAHALAGEGGGWHTEVVNNLVGYKTTHQDEIGHWEDVLVQDAYDEVVTTGYKCSTCGKTK